MRIFAKVFLVSSLAILAAAPAALATDHTVIMNGDYGGAMFFDPTSITVYVGDRVRWTNVILEIHTSTSGEECAPNGLWTTGSVNSGQTSAYITFNTAGTFPYYCRFHCGMGMIGDVVVKSAPVRTDNTSWGRVKALFAAKLN
jgi:plastocyanin